MRQLRASLLLTAGTIGGQALTLAAAPVLSRLYQPADFAALAIFVAISSVLSVGATLRFEIAIVLPRSDRVASALRLLSLGAILGLALALAVVVAIAGTLGGLDFVLSRVGGVDAALLLLPGTMLIAATQVYTYVAMRAENWRSMAVAKLVQGLATVGLQIALVAAAGGGSLSLILGYLVGYVGSFATLQAGVPRLGVLTRLRLWRRPVRVAWRRYARYPRHVLPAELIDTFSSNMVLFLISGGFTALVVGSYAMAMRVLATPTALVGAAVGQVFYRHFVAASGERQRRRLLLRTWLALAGIGALPFSAILVWGESLFVLAFGSSWGVAGHVASLLAPMLFVMFVSSPTSGMVHALGLQRLLLRLVVLAMAYRLLAVLWGLSVDSLTGSIIALSVCEIAKICYFNWVAYRKI